MPIDATARIAPTARIHPEAEIGPHCVVGEYCVIESDVRLGAHCVLEPYVFLRRWTTLGEANEISAGTVLGSDPLDKNFKGARSYLVIGNRNKVREHFTISRATKPEASTIIGDDNYIMTTGHIAHDCVIGHRTVVCSSALLAGYVHVGDQAFISGGVVVHQHSRIGRLAMIGGNTRVNQDLPPFFLYSDFNVSAKGINAVGLKRAGFSLAQLQEVKECYKILYRSGLKQDAALAQLARMGSLAEELANFVRSSQRGIVREL
jgi:UDP-N-acetylglucosamine acyltransferase